MDILPFRQVSMSDVLGMDQNDHFALFQMRVTHTCTHHSYVLH